jgi:hypothetical protein
MLSNFGISRKSRAVVALIGVQDASAQESEPGAAVHGVVQSQVTDEGGLTPAGPMMAP